MKILLKTLNSFLDHATIVTDDNRKFFSPQEVEMTPQKTFFHQKDPCLAQLYGDSVEQVKLDHGEIWY